MPDDELTAMDDEQIGGKSGALSSALPGGLNRLHCLLQQPCNRMRDHLQQNSTLIP
jgi:hypothetical protein